ncbi:hypothetical protein BHE74_00006765 [Ensete ventricosum]|uniref:Uncharacterized protein n=1 Tax=Ensete ventricosum TaxID=4639 RepID=A0A444E7B0_ENSVE|nr:hypothetical protein B296_00032853 [Ensete ventricosum]RWW06276.1 hypothetical protein GW17_00030403 [Ensete ventricosum]RWW84618.1 hypothetical protein BHE74_00006765 [Ensete ventricosum]RZS02054.1 hypothetical protein BHM03_00032016 [Ensete ventricosum]
MGLLELFVTASVPVMKVLLVTGVGSFLATGNIGILCHEARKHLNNVSFQLCFTCLIQLLYQPIYLGQLQWKAWSYCES